MITDVLYSCCSYVMEPIFEEATVIFVPGLAVYLIAVVVKGRLLVVRGRIQELGSVFLDVVQDPVAGIVSG